ncbi:MAG: transketolase [Desulfobacterota bacterium]|nr:transketolase [Thermodesulfobacteriota bacterium]
MIQRGFFKRHLDPSEVSFLQECAHRARGDVLAMTTLAGCGHPGGSLSSIDLYTTLYHCANVYPDNPRHPDRDRIIISHGHTSPGAYAALAHAGFFSPEDAIIGFRVAGSMFEGHVERSVPGIEWGTGNLGQGLSAGCGFALGARLKRKQYHVFVVMGDGEQQKGQISEARRCAVKYRLTNLTAIIDYNQLQISGSIHDIMPQNIKEEFCADAWKVIEIDGHDFAAIYDALYTATHDRDAPYVIIAHTVMGKGVSFMEHVAKYHGVALTREQYDMAMQELGLPNTIEQLRAKRAQTVFSPSHVPFPAPPDVLVGEPRTYKEHDRLDNRSAFGNALKDIAVLNKNRSSSTPIAVFDCDLETSVKVDGFKSVMPDHFFEIGIQEHNTATMAGALSIDGVLSVFADFGVFGVCETYNQHRLNDINRTGLKLVCTHLGLDVGEDGKTHQCIDYIGLFRNLYTFNIIIPADPNQTDRATRYICSTSGNFLLGMGRSRTPIILDEHGTPLFGDGYTFTYGAIDLVRKGHHAVIMTYGCMLHRVLAAWEILHHKGYAVRVLNVSCPTALDPAAIQEAVHTGLIITCEDHNVHSGLGSIVADHLATHALSARLIKRGIADYSFSGPPDELFKRSGLDAESLAALVEHELKKM